jgi:Xaa-Pro aminopeptidase
MNEKTLFQQRTSRCQALMQERGVDLLALSPGPNLHYLSGFREEPGERLLLLLLPSEGSPCFIAPQLYEEHLRRDSWVEDLRIWRDGEDPIPLLQRAIQEKAPSVRRISVDDRMWALFLLPLLQVCPNARFEVASQLLSELRMRKDPRELEQMRKAATIVDEVFEWVCQQSIEGLTERELAGALEAEMRRRGAEGIAFETLVASGPNGALPHHRAGERRIQRGDLVILDYGCRIGGYHSDITRTVACGPPDEQARKIYEIVQQVQEAAVQAVRPGVPAQEVDRTARSLITQAGYGERFIHRTGHGIGLEVHEPPYIVEGNDLPLEAGMTFSVEPGIYLPGQLGIRVEDIVAVTAEGVERLNRCSRELIVLD